MTEISFYSNSDYNPVREILELGDLFWDVSDSEENFNRKIKESPESILVAVEGKKVVGVGMVVLDFIPLLFRLAVHPDYRGRGIGKLLLERREQIVKKNGYNHVSLLIADSNTELQKRYETYGYKKGGSYTWMS